MCIDLNGEIDTELAFGIRAGTKPSAHQLSELLSAKILDRLDIWIVLHLTSKSQNKIQNATAIWMHFILGLWIYH